MKRSLRDLIFAVTVGVCLAVPALAQSSSDQPTSNGVADQFKSGANSVGNGAAHIGEGIKQGAIMTWDAVKDGATAVGHRLSGTSGPATDDSAGSAQQSR